ncbi:MAG: protein-export chaperone SecB [Alphaproteobacteria bacterium]
MSDENETGGDAGAAQAGAGAPPLAIRAQYIKDLSFESPAAPQVFYQGSGNPSVSIQVNVTADRLEEKLFEVVLNVEARADTDAGEPVFVVELAYGGVVQVGAVPDEHVRPLILIEGPRLLFPFARAVVADVTRDGGFPPLMIAPIDFVDMFRRGLAEGGPQTA